MDVNFEHRRDFACRLNISQLASPHYLLSFFLLLRFCFSDKRKIDAEASTHSSSTFPPSLPRAEIIVFDEVCKFPPLGPKNVYLPSPSLRSSPMHSLSNAHRSGFPPRGRGGGTDVAFLTVRVNQFRFRLPAKPHFVLVCFDAAYSGGGCDRKCVTAN